MALTKNGNRKSWLLSGWNTNIEKEKADVQGEVSTQSETTQTNPTFSREDLGAALSSTKIQNLFESFIDKTDKNGSEVRSAAKEREVEFFKTRQGEVYGFVKDGVVYLDPDMMNPNTLLHEYTHLWARAARVATPTTRIDNLRKAEEMERKFEADNDKESAKKIKLATGWERGADGKWRYEEPDGRCAS